MTIANYVQGKISLGRLQRFIELEELDGQGRTWTNRFDLNDNAVHARAGYYDEQSFCTCADLSCNVTNTGTCSCRRCMNVQLVPCTVAMAVTC
jgi:predicted nucleic acid-binding Zn finger protein